MTASRESKVHDLSYFKQNHTWHNPTPVLFMFWYIYIHTNTILIFVTTMDGKNTIPPTKEAKLLPSLQHKQYNTNVITANNPNKNDLLVFSAWDGDLIDSSLAPLRLSGFLLEQVWTLKEQSIIDPSPPMLSLDKRLSNIIDEGEEGSHSKDRVKFGLRKEMESHWGNRANIEQKTRSELNEDIQCDVHFI